MTTRFGARISCALLPMVIGLSGCAFVSSSGPSVGDIRKGSKTGQFELVAVDSPDKLPPPASAEIEILPTPTRSGYAAALAPGDVISIAFFEVGVRLFSSGPESPTTDSFDPSARSQRLSGLEIDGNGTIRLPYLGTINAAGETPTSLGHIIERKMVRMSQNPQVIVSLEAAVGSAVMVSGVVARPGRLKLSAAREQLRDVMALAGGLAADAGSLNVRIKRNGIVTEAPADNIANGALGDVYIEPGDHIDIVRQPRSYSMIGYTNQINEFPLPATKVTLVEAIAKAGGVNDNLANPSAVFLFRMEKAADGQQDRPVIYHINMKQPYSYFLAREIYLRDDDVLYVGGAEVNRPSRLLNIISQVFTPILLARSLTQ